MTMNATETQRSFSALQRHAETIQNDEPVTYTDATFPVGSQHPQGDVLITRLAKLPALVTKLANPQAQLAPGTTQGSRHILRDMKGVTLYRVYDTGPLDGPVIVADAEIAIDHPEHANVILPAGCYAITYQRAFAEELRRVQD